ALSSGSACSSGKPSHVLTALGLSPSLCRASLRFGLGRFTTPAEIEQVAATIQQTLTSLPRIPSNP
ncbi:MAG: IscS subfamily cysteine desulfurase, partial [Synechococcus sp.]|nr:IscS subfamily cysteine desulfurase [Synechococcus sp.]